MKKLMKMRVEDFEAFLFTAKGLVTNCVCHCLGGFSMHIEPFWPDLTPLLKCFLVFHICFLVPHN